MRRLFASCYQYAWFWVVGILLLTLWLCTYVPRTEIQVSNESLMGRDAALNLQYETVRDRFGSDQIVAVYVRDPALFKPHNLEQLAGIQRELSRLPHTQRVESLFTVSNISRTADGLDTGPLLNPGYIPNDEAVLREKRDSALNNPLLRDRILSRDGEATLFSVFLKPLPETGEQSQGDYYRDIYLAIESILKPYQSEFDSLYQVGAPRVQETMGRYILEDQLLLLPIAAGILFLLIGILLRSLLAALIPLLNTVIATIWILAFMVWLDIPVNILNSIIPALLLIIGATEDVHFLAEYRRESQKNNSPEKIVESVGGSIGFTLLLTGVTTTLGFASTGITNLEILREFGITAGIAMALRMGLTLIFVPALLRFAKPRKPAPSHASDTSPETRSRRTPGWWYTRLIMDGVLTRPKRVIALMAVIGVSIGYFSNRVEVGNDLVEFLEPDSEMVRQIVQTGEELAGTKVLFLTLYGEPGEFKSPAGLKRIANIQKRLDENAMLDDSLSLADFVAVMHGKFSGRDSEEDHIIPGSSDLISQYLLFLDNSSLKPYINTDYSTANIILRTNVHDSRQFSAFYRQIQYQLESGVFGLVDFTLTGQSILIAEAVDEIVRGQVLSLAVIIVLLFIIVASLFLSWKASLLAVLSNLFPIAVLFGVMGLLNIPLNVGTCMVAAITIGIAVDDTLHLMVRYNRELKHSKNERVALESSLLAEFHPVATTSLALAAGFSVLLFSHFIPLRQFAGLSAMVIFLAAIADLLITPVLLSTTRLITLWDILGLRLRRALLERSLLFEGMRSWQAKKIILSAHLEDYQIGDRLVSQGQLGETMYVILDGDVEVRRGPDHQKTLLAHLTVGDTFGEIALVSRSRRTADVVATTPTRVLAMDWDSLLNLQRFTPYLASRLFLNLSRIMGERMISSLGKLDTAAPFLVKLEREQEPPSTED